MTFLMNRITPERRNFHHLHSPRKVINTFYENLKDGGIYVGEEGIISHMFAYLPTFAWQRYLPNLVPPEQTEKRWRYRY